MRPSPLPAAGPRREIVFEDLADAASWTSQYCGVGGSEGLSNVGVKSITRSTPSARPTNALVACLVAQFNGRVFPGTWMVSKGAVRAVCQIPSGR